MMRQECFGDGGLVVNTKPEAVGSNWSCSSECGLLTAKSGMGKGKNQGSGSVRGVPA